MSPKVWQFISVDQSEPRKTSQRVIRQAAMKDFRRTERLVRAKTHMAAQAKRKEQEEDLSQWHTREAVELDRIHGAQCIIGRIPGKGIKFVDPFALTSLPDRKDAHILLMHCKSCHLKVWLWSSSHSFMQTFEDA